MKKKLLIPLFLLLFALLLVLGLLLYQNNRVKYQYKEQVAQYLESQNPSGLLVHSDLVSYLKKHKKELNLVTNHQDLNAFINEESSNFDQVQAQLEDASINYVVMKRTKAKDLKTNQEIYLLGICHWTEVYSNQEYAVLKK